MGKEYPMWAEAFGPDQGYRVRAGALFKTWLLRDKKQLEYLC